MANRKAADVWKSWAMIWLTSAIIIVQIRPRAKAQSSIYLRSMKALMAPRQLTSSSVAAGFDERSSKISRPLNSSQEPHSSADARYNSRAPIISHFDRGEAQLVERQPVANRPELKPTETQPPARFSSTTRLTRKRVGAFVISGGSNDAGEAVQPESEREFNDESLSPTVLSVLRTSSTATARDVSYSDDDNTNVDEDNNFSDLTSVVYTHPVIKYTLPPPVIRNEQSLAIAAAFSPTIKSSNAASSCSITETGLCNHQTWTDYALALTGLLPKTDLCLKYLPEQSCLAVVLKMCGMKMDSLTRHMMIAVGKVLVYWCSNPDIIAAADQSASCFSSALLGAITFDGCLTDSVDFPKSLVRAFFQTKKDATSNQDLPTGFSIPSLINSLIGGFQGNTLSCIYSSIAKECGADAAHLALGPALDEIEETRPMSQQKKLLTATTQFLPILDDSAMNLKQKDSQQFKQIQAPTGSGADSNSNATQLCYKIFLLLFCLLLSFAVV